MPTTDPSQDGDEGNVFDLDVARASRFLDDLADHPFACVVLTGEDELTIVSKDMDPEELDRFKKALAVLEEGD